MDWLAYPAAAIGWALALGGPFLIGVDGPLHLIGVAAVIGWILVAGVLVGAMVVLPLVALWQKISR